MASRIIMTMVAAESTAGGRPAAIAVGGLAVPRCGGSDTTVEKALALHRAQQTAAPWCEIVLDRSPLWR